MSLSQPLMSQTGDIDIPKAEVECFENVCRRHPINSHPTGCASCQTLRVFLPLSAQVSGILYSSTASGDAGDVPMRRVPPGELAWSFFAEATVHKTDTNVVVES